LVVAAAVAAAVMALLGYAGGGRLGNFGDVGVDQVTFGPAVFLWFLSIGGLTVAMAGGLAKRPKPVKPAPQPEPDDAVTDVVVLEEPAAAQAPATAADVVDVEEDVEEVAPPRADRPEPDEPLLDPEEHFLTDGDPVEKPREQAD
jgi:hypothetical protein